jgi:hypothetical protein
MLRKRSFLGMTLRIAAFLVFFTGLAAHLPAQTLSAAGGGKYDQIAPNPVPITPVDPINDPTGPTGASDIGVLGIDLSASGGDAYIGQIDIVLNNYGTDDTLGTVNIPVSGVKVFLNSENKYDPGLDSPASAWVALNTSSSKVLNTSVTITLLDNGALIPNNSTGALWIAFDYDQNTKNNTPAQISYFINTIHYGPSSDKTASQFDPADVAEYGSDPTEIDSVNDYLVTFSASGAVANTTENQGTNDVLVMIMEFAGGVGDEAVTKEIATVTFQSLGQRDADIGSPGVRLHVDGNSNDLYDDSVTDPQVAAGSLSGGQAILTTIATDPNARFDQALKKYLVVVNVDQAALVGNTIGLQIADPSTDITFRDALGDPGTYLSQQYEQTGYITENSTIPTTNNTFTITPAPDASNPEVLSTNPIAGTTTVEPDATIEIVFSQHMLQDTVGGGVLNAGNYELRDIVNDIVISVTPSYSSQRVTLTPASTLDWGTEYRVTLDQLIEDVDGQTLFDRYGNDYTFTFTVRNQYPTFTDPTVIKNRIGTGTNSEALIFIPEPPGGPSEKVTMQVFTTTGKLVRTFYKNVPHSAIGTDPISWNGTNDRGENLGPGMYFVQIRTSSYKRVLKVMIVR